MNPVKDNKARILLCSLQKIEFKLAVIETNEQLKINTPKTSKEIIEKVIEKMVLQDTLKLLEHDIKELLEIN